MRERRRLHSLRRVAAAQELRRLSAEREAVDAQSEEAKAKSFTGAAQERLQQSSDYWLNRLKSGGIDVPLLQGAAIVMRQQQEAVDAAQKVEADAAQVTRQKLQEHALSAAVKRNTQTTIRRAAKRVTKLFEEKALNELELGAISTWRRR